MDREANLPLEMISGLVEENRVVFSAWNVNGLFSLDLRSGDVEFLTLLPWFRGKYGYGYILHDNNRVFLSPCSGKSVLELNRNNWSLVKEYPLDDLKLGARWARCGNMIKANGKLYLIPYHAHAITELDLETHKLEYFGDCYDGIKDASWVRPGPLFSGGVLAEDKIWFACIQANIIVCFDVNTKKTTLHEVKETTDIFVDICYDGSCFWISCKSGKLFKWKESEGVLFELDEICNQGKADCAMSYYDNKVWYVTHDLNRVISIDVDDCCLNDEKFEFKNRNNCEGNFMFIGSGMLYRAGHLYVLDQSTHEVNDYTVDLCGNRLGEYISKLMKLHVANDSIIQEENISLELMIKGLSEVG